MLTDEQINNLNIGDTLILNNYPVSYVSVYPDGIINATDDKAEECCKTDCFFPLKYLSLPPKHDPCRLFKKGDIVEMDTHGRDIAASMKKSGVELGERYTVTEDENNTGYVSFIGDDGIEHHSMFFWLKLVTPVEELMPYKVWDTTFSFNVGVEDSKAVFYYGADMSTCPYTKEQAKAAAEAERDRLNAEWRKEQSDE